MAQRSKFKDPGLFATLIIIIYSAFVFGWWPVDIYVAGISLVAWLMFFGLFIWFILTVAYVVWIERIEKD
ncbi:hypothetical protein [Salinicoccus sp. Marseille-QA3877]